MKGIRAKLSTLLLTLLLLVPTMANAHTVSTTGPSPDLRSALGRLLGEHAILAVVAMQKGIDGAPDFRKAANALNQNTDDLTVAIASVYGKDGAAAFKTIWSSHIGYFVDYVKATAAKDEAGTKKAIADLEAYRMEQAKFFADANPYFDESIIASELKHHIDHLLSAFNNYANKNYTAAYKDAQTAYTHMFATGDALAAGIAKQFPSQYSDASSTNPASDLRSALEQKLGEHALLAVFAMQKGIDGKADFADIAASLNRNTDDITAAVASMYGKEAGEAFKTIWSSHIGYFVDYVKAMAAKDEAAAAKAVHQLEQYRMEQAKFFAGAIPSLSEQTLAEGLKMHIGHLLDAFNAYVAKDYAKAYADVRTAYSHMFPTGAALAAGIAAQFPEQFHTANTSSVPSVQKVWFQVKSNLLTIDGSKTTMDTMPFVNQGTTYIPLRYLAEGIGAKVVWDASDDSVWIIAGENKAEFWLGADFMEMNGQRIEIGDPIIMKDNRTQVPVRFIAALFGWDVRYNTTDWSITLTKAMAMEASSNHH
ncbi:copper amine oxidase N-terminal domain-containing protein [Paenibacillus aurantiacus]|uniref:Copper amine oxidase N-terminal domain-containing protein n=1 Tax=Paenibacillus aurantiacus TaxID=1936118 RepID=A0ABV5KST5_9BACL